MSVFRIYDLVESLLLYLDPPDIINLSQTSRGIGQMIREVMSNKNFHNRIYPRRLLTFAFDNYSELDDHPLIKQFRNIYTSLHVRAVTTSNLDVYFNGSVYNKGNIYHLDGPVSLIIFFRGKLEGYEGPIRETIKMKATFVNGRLSDIVASSVEYSHKVFTEKVCISQYEYGIQLGYTITLYKGRKIEVVYKGIKEEEDNEYERIVMEDGYNKRRRIDDRDMSIWDRIVMEDGYNKRRRIDNRNMSIWDRMYSLFFYVEIDASNVSNSLVNEVIKHINDITSNYFTLNMEMMNDELYKLLKYKLDYELIRYIDKDRSFLFNPFLYARIHNPDLLPHEIIISASPSLLKG